jgi:hypothetical protein
MYVGFFKKSAYIRGEKREFSSLINGGQVVNILVRTLAISRVQPCFALVEADQPCWRYKSNKARDSYMPRGVMALTQQVMRCGGERQTENSGTREVKRIVH